jgi:hypothetical protein
LTHIPSFGIFPANHLPNPKLSTQPVHFGMLSSPQKVQPQGDVIDLRHNQAPKPVHFGADNPPTYDDNQLTQFKNELKKKMRKKNPEKVYDIANALLREQRFKNLLLDEAYYEMLVKIRFPDGPPSTLLLMGTPKSKRR